MVAVPIAPPLPASWPLTGGQKQGEKLAESLEVLIKIKPALERA